MFLRGHRTLVLEPTRSFQTFRVKSCARNYRLGATLWLGGNKGKWIIII